MADFRGDPTFIKKALTRDEYYEQVAKLGRPLNWMPQHHRSGDVKQNNGKTAAEPMEPPGS